MSTGKRTWATVLLDRSCLPGVLVLHYTLQKTGTNYPFIVVMTPETARDQGLMSVVTAAGISTVLVEEVQATHNGQLVEGMWQKLSVWTLTDYERIVLLDSNQIVLQPIDELMTMSLPAGSIAASQLCTCNCNHPLLTHRPHGRTPANCAYTRPTTSSHLHSSTIVLRPSPSERTTLFHALHNHPNITNMPLGEQDLLAAVYYNRWTPLHYAYNALESVGMWHPELGGHLNPKVRCFDLERPWKGVGVGDGWWWREFEELEGLWWGNGHAGGDPERRALWREVVKPEVQWG
ncbi:nucleotide-diphospho-sugar transferase [Chaetomidium leptoderma]|uniref:Nucleotide-diphospho-sugar transferase n=1 Tax=Chaetomidium leptoderma TaxID=669021 RepID=A0AAN6ZRX7_9PEZI|nr:nucleotide-diphospho-sugar transferase [Chaetomidium leptoderma]